LLEQKMQNLNLVMNPTEKNGKKYILICQIANSIVKLYSHLIVNPQTVFIL